jgi:hypothetical protein
MTQIRRKVAASALVKSITYKCLLNTALRRDRISKTTGTLGINRTLNAQFAPGLTITARESLHLLDLKG